VPVLKKVAGTGIRGQENRLSDLWHAGGILKERAKDGPLEAGLREVEKKRKRAGGGRLQALPARRVTAPPSSFRREREN